MQGVKCRKRKWWKPIEEEILVEMWEERIADLRGNRQKDPIYAEMSNELQEMGVCYTPEEVKMKFYDFTKRYRQEKRLVNIPGACPSTWDLFNRIDQIIGIFQIHNVKPLMQDSLIETDDPISSCTDPLYFSDSEPGTSASSTSTALAPKKRKRADMDEEIKNTLLNIEKTKEEF